MGYKRLEILNMEGNLYMGRFLIGYVKDFRIIIHRYSFKENMFINGIINRKVRILKGICENKLLDEIVIDLAFCNRPAKIIFKRLVAKFKFKKISERKTKIYIKFARKDYKGKMTNRIPENIWT